MNQFEQNCATLEKYITQAAAPIIARWVVEYDFKLKITRKRTSKLGDYSWPQRGRTHHIITINHNLNKHAFLITLVHEVAHLQTYNQYKTSVSPHGAEWKTHYKQLMRFFLNPDFFPTDVLLALQKHLLNPAASSCVDTHLQRVLDRYDNSNEKKTYIESIPYKSVFKYEGHRLFEKGEKVRTRYKCKDLSTGAVYLFHSLAEVELQTMP
ncbi:MAG: SprT-like domain-containing protein [Bacteroidetes bacterium]|nr:SprT-like domain-containing protein [Bacteroidota bacterium]